MESIPPKLADKLLSFFCKDSLLEEIQGDLYQYYERQVGEKGSIWAGLIYWFQVFNFIRPFAIKKTQNSNTTIMLKYNLIIALRNLRKQKFYSFINISGLSIAATACLFIAIFIKDEVGYDKHFENHENIFRVSSHIFFNGNDIELANSPAAMKEALKADVPEILESGRFRERTPILLQKGDQFIKQDGVAWADADILNIFKLNFIYGSPKNALVEPQSILLSQTASEKLFGYNDPVGEMIKSAENQSFRVDGVYSDIPKNSHFHFNVLLSMESLEHSKNKMWLSNNYKNYFVLDEKASYNKLNEKLPSILKPYLEPKMIELGGITYEDFYNGGNFLDYKLIPLTDIHLLSNLQSEIEANGSINNIYIFISIGMMILFLACFNFMNLSTARSSKRAKEVGIRKVMGSYRSSLIGQFLTESVLISLFAFSVAIGLVHLGLPYFNSFTEKDIVNPLFGTLNLWFPLLMSSLFIGILAGIYPAFFLSSFLPVKVLKGQFKFGNGGKLFKNGLVVFQFSISIFMIMGTSVVYKQLIYSQNKNLGYDQNKVIVIENTYSLEEGIEPFKNELAADVEIETLTSSYFLPSRDTRSDNTFNKEENSGAENAINMQSWHIDDQYIPTLSINLTEGRNFDRELASDSNAVILNKTAASVLGYDGSAIGKKLKYVGENDKLIIIGVVEDFYFDSFKQEVRPLMFQYGGSIQSLAIKYRSKDPLALVERMEDVWGKHASGHPFEYTFMDQEFNANFKEDKKLGMILAFFSVLAIIIACLGLFALASYTAQQRKKEISIRKVLGASVPNIMRLLFSNFSRLLVIASFIAIPSGYFLLSIWLDDYAYRTNIGVLVMIAACTAVFLVALITVGGQTFKSARANPVDNLHCE